MTGPITWEAVISLVGLVAVVSTLWWRFSSNVSNVDKDLQQHKLHVAQTYATKNGVAEQMTDIKAAIAEVGRGVNGVNERLDRVIEARPSRRQS